jgi:hypothetical protein
MAGRNPFGIPVTQKPPVNKPSVNGTRTYQVQLFISLVFLSDSPSGVNRKFLVNFTMTWDTRDCVYKYDNQDFFPINYASDNGFGNTVRSADVRAASFCVFIRFFPFDNVFFRSVQAVRI